MENFVFFVYITSLYGTNITKIFKDYANCNRKLARLMPQRIFLIRCRKARIIPYFIQNRCLNQLNLLPNNNRHRSKLNDIIRNFQFKILNVLISEKDDHIKHRQSKLEFLENEICSLNDRCANIFLTKQKSYKSKEIQKYKETNTKKFDNLKRKTLDKLNFHTIVNPKWFTNLTDTIIPAEVIWLLSLGPKFALPIAQNEFPIFNFIADIENILSCEQDDNMKEIKRSKVANILHKQKYSKQVKTPIEAEILRIYKLTKKFLSENKDILIMQADKGKRTVVMKKSEYETKMLELLSDQNTYKTLKYDTTEALHARLNYITKRLVDNKWMSKEEQNMVSMYNTAIAKAYGLPKVHKPGEPLRILVASYESPAYNLSKFLTKILKNLTKDSSYNVRNSFDFINKIRNLTIDLGSKIMSFDVVSLFTNIPLDLLEQILDKRWSEIQQHTKIPKDEFFQLINFVVRDCNQFVYDGIIYKQLEGVPMGLPISPILADIVMEYMLNEAISKLPFKLQECIKYVDDLFIVVPSHLISYTKYIFNTVHKNIQFTIEMEKQGFLPYLDVLIMHNEGGLIEFDWYCKPTASSRILNFFSNHTFTQKLNVMDNVIKRLYDLSSKKFHAKNTRLITTILQQNGYPKSLISKRIKKYHYNVHQKQRISVVTQSVASQVNDEPETSEIVNYRSLRFNESCSMNIGKILCKGVANLELGYKPINVNRSLFSKLKQKTDEMDLYNVIYELPCFGNGYTTTICDLEYVGTTGHRVHIRGDQHVDDIKVYNQTNDLNNTTAVVHHYLDAGHVPDTDKMKVLAVEHCYTKRKVLEALYIMTKNSMNFRRDTDNISDVYKSILN